MSDPKKLIAMLFLKAAPQDLSFKPALAVRLAFGYWFSGVLVLTTTLQPSDVLASMLLSLVVVAVFVSGILRVFNQQTRFIQTFSAVAGVGILFNLLSWPILMILAGDDGQADDTLVPALSFVFLMMISWEVLVKAHIFKNALEIAMVNALLLSFALFFIAMTLSQLLFPGDAT